MDPPPDTSRRVRLRVLCIAGLWLASPLPAAPGRDDEPVPLRSLTPGEIAGMTAARDDRIAGVAELAEKLLAHGLKVVEPAPPTASMVKNRHATPLMDALDKLKDFGAQLYLEQTSRLFEDRGPRIDVRTAALDALEKSGAARDTAAIRAVVMDESAPPGIRARGAEMLLSMGELPAAEASRFVAGLLKSARRADAIWILDLLVRMSAPESVEAILAHIGRDGLRRYDAPLHAVKVLTELGFDRRCHEVAYFLSAEDPHVRSGALAALRFFHAVEFAPQVAASLAGGGPEKVRQDALVTLAGLQGRKALPSVIPLLAPDESDELQLLALGYIEAWKAAEATNAVAGLLAPQVSGKVRERALGTLVEIDGTGAARDVAKLLDEHDNPVMRRQAAEAIAELHAREAAPSVAGLLRDGDPNLRIAGLNSLAALGASDHADAVAALLEDDKISVRREAVRTLGTLRATQHAGALAAKMSDPVMRTLIIATLGRMEAVSETPALFRLLLDPDDDLRRRSLSALMECGGHPPVEGCAFLMEAAHLYPEQRADLIIAAYFLYFQNADVAPAIRWLGNRQDDERPPGPFDPQPARETVTALQILLRSAAAANCPEAVMDAGSLAAEIVANVSWTPQDAGWLAEVSYDLAKFDLPGKARAVRRIVQDLREGETWPQTVRILVIIAFGLLLPLCWILVRLRMKYGGTAQG